MEDELLMFVFPKTNKKEFDFINQTPFLAILNYSILKNFLDRFT